LPPPNVSPFTETSFDALPAHAGVPGSAPLRPLGKARPTVEGTDPASWEWRDSRDVLSAAPEFHSLLLDNDMRVLATRIGPGETVPLHTHRWPSILYVLSAGHFVRRDCEGRVLSDTRGTGTLPEPGTCVWITSIPPHTVENVDGTEIRLLNVELKRG